MKLRFFIKSSTVNIEKYTIKDIPGSSGRLDVISRCILAALIRSERFSKNVQIWVFLDNYGTFIFNPKLFDYDIFPKNEILFTDYFVNFLRNCYTDTLQISNPLNSINISNFSITEAIKHFLKLSYDVYILKEDGKDFFTLLEKMQENEKIVFLIGSQEDKFLKSEELLAFKIPTVSIGNQSYLASSVIRILKLHLMPHQ